MLRNKQYEGRRKVQWRARKGKSPRREPALWRPASTITPSLICFHPASLIHEDCSSCWIDHLPCLCSNDHCAAYLEGPLYRNLAAGVTAINVIINRHLNHIVEGEDDKMTACLS
ncbi:hypothetical protein BO70DRAFT_195203 [Aspergillus heteromorphus CBS 117.55]|uniref:Uncharacterized protein n=1 Tax=Aspergillus heteromorphus CBS 117.55 TaxID=1448321 RepID=A0A317WMC1_9EURO|nr:uncharacterized protein BO70DRAFT_195203 [Aspergillus heteromorphus CBS 117.55]PWY87483.1 hypothetical protein BO70DRAFT_195203 [Aspergillus heteromorphus CBS 117.55]